MNTNGSNVVVGYRTTNPGVLAVWDKWQDEMQAQHARIRAFKDSVDPEDRLQLRARRNSVPVYFSGDVVPHGWRRTAKGWIVPNKRLKAGKEAQATLDELRRSAPDLSSRLMGMPDHAIVGNHFYEPGAFKHDGAIYVYWGGMPEGVDSEVWSELKLSEFYAAQEAHDSEPDS